MDIEKHKPIFRLAATGEDFPVTEVHGSFSRLAGLEGKNRNILYEAYLIQKPQPAIRLDFSPGAELAGRAMLMEAYRHTPSGIFTIEEGAVDPDYLIYAEGEKWALAFPFSKRPLFQRVGPYSETAAEDFLKKLESVAKWRRIFEMAGLLGGIPDSYFSIQLERITEIGNYSYDAKGEVVDWRGPLLLEYKKFRGAWYLPAFRLKVKNTSHRRLWASVLYLEDNFGISNELLPYVELASGEEHWLEDRIGQYPTNAIRVWIHDVYKQWNISSIREYLKIFISVERLNTDALNQQGLPYEGPIEGQRGFGSSPKPLVSAWTTRIIELNIHRPFE